MTERAWKGHALWLVGFRPFFPLACAVAVVAPVLWVLMLAGVVSPPSGLQPQQWHAHEMFYGFGLAVLGGFLLTATKNWVQVRGHHGRALQVLVAAWLFERATLWWGGAWPAWLRWVGLEAYGVLLVLLVSWTLVRGRKQDSYRDNFYFVVALPVFLAARALLLSASYFAQGHAVTLALFRLAFVVMLERTLTQFMKAAFQVALPRVAVLDGGIKVLALTLVAGPWLPGLVRPTVEVALAVLVTARFLSWSPHLAFQRIELGVMYVGALALALQLVLDAFPLTWVGALPTHVFTFGTMGLIIPAMFTRIAHGHTGRPVRFEAVDRAVLWLMVLGFVARVVAPQVWPGAYRELMWLAAGCWALGFAVVGARITPLVLAERVDGREH
ncbi:MAG: NnrS family protein [Archangium sp.]|nr:NnrS family protein [Archangium sp.]